MLTLARILLAVALTLAGILGGALALWTHGGAAGFLVLFLGCGIGAMMAPDI